jgi:peptide/nickel transport system permease protein
VPPDVPPVGRYWMGTTSRGQDLFWLLTFAIRNTCCSASSSPC